MACAAFLGVPWPYHGWMNIAPIAGEVRNPCRNLPLSLLAGVLVVVALYLGSNLAYYLMVPGGEIAALKGKDTSVATVYALRLLGDLGAAAASAAIMCSVFGSLNGNLLVGPRLLFAMGEDGLAPGSLHSVHPRWRTPAAAIAVYAVWPCLQVIAAAALTATGVLDPRKSHFDMLTDFAMFGAVIFETMAVLAIFQFRRTMPDAPRPYRCPGYPLVPLLYTIIPGFVLVNTFINQVPRRRPAWGSSPCWGSSPTTLGLQRTVEAWSPSEG
ncbi:MAG: APC family permease [Gemmataceae bacterium]